LPSFGPAFRPVGLFDDGGVGVGTVVAGAHAVVVVVEWRGRREALTMVVVSWQSCVTICDDGIRMAAIAGFADSG
jgi:hypothetical protein